jgi:hypothetical protein
MSVLLPQARSRSVYPSTSPAGPPSNPARRNVQRAARMRSTGPCSAARTRLSRWRLSARGLSVWMTLGQYLIDNSFLYRPEELKVFTHRAQRLFNLPEFVQLFRPFCDNG